VFEVLFDPLDADRLTELVDVAQVFEGGFEAFGALEDEVHANDAVFAAVRVEG
jgi:hypothetical protein